MILVPSFVCRTVPIALLLWTIAAPVHAQGTAEYIVQFRAGTGIAARGAVAAGAGASVRRNFRRVSAAAVRVPNEQALLALRRNPAVVAVVPDRQVSVVQKSVAKKPAGGASTVSAQVVPAGVVRVGRPGASSDGSGIGVAILDTGVDLQHPDLAGTVDTFSAFGGSCHDGNGHGTHVAGIAAARDNAWDVIGVAPGATVYCLKVLDANGYGSDAGIMAALEQVLEMRQSIRVVNMSLGRPGTVDDNPMLRDLIAQVDEAGISIVVAAGNDPGVDVLERIPSAYPQVISVASTTATTGSSACRSVGAIPADTASTFTTDGLTVTVSAPGEDREDLGRNCAIGSVGILSTQLGGGTTRMSGTSMAAPHVAGVAARLYQGNPSLTPAGVKARIISEATGTSAPLDSPSRAYTFDGRREGIARAPAP